MKQIQQIWNRFKNLFQSQSYAINVHQLQLFFDALDESVFVLNPMGIVTWANQKFYKEFSGASDTLINQTLDHFRQMENIRTTPTSLEMSADKAFEMALWMGEETAVFLQVQPLTIFRNMLASGTPFLCQIIAPEKQPKTIGAQPHLSITNQVEQLKDIFLSNISHEMRTPIANLKLYHDLIQRNPQKLDTYLFHLGKEINRIQTIVDDLINYTIINEEGFTPRFDWVNLNELSMQQLTDFMKQSKEKGIQLSIIQEPQLPLVWGDAGLLNSIIKVLLTNAINFSPQNGQVIVTTFSQQRNNQQWAGMSIQDNGPGISPEDLPHIFERFYRGAASHQFRVPGIGLGLVIAKTIINHHKGELSVSAPKSVETGAVFTFLIPTTS